MSKEIGTVISTLDSPSPSLVRFVVNEGIVHRGQFVEMEYSEGILIALVSNVIKTNRYFERADSVKEFESDGKALIEQFPTTEWEFLVAETKPLGVFTQTLTKRSTYPPSPGTKVKIATKENLKKFFSFDEKNGLHLGEVEYHETPVHLNMTKLLQKHCAILAQSGFGKCVSPKTKILLSDGKNVEIGHFIDSILEKGFEVENGIEYSKHNSGLIKNLSLDFSNKLTESTIKAFSRRKAPEEMFYIKTRTGKEIELTLEHPIPIIDEYIKWVEAKNLKKGDFTLIPKPLMEGSKQEIDFIELWKDSIKARIAEKNILIKIKNSIKEKTSIKKLAEKLNIRERQLHYWLDNGIPLNYLGKICLELDLNLNEIKKEIQTLKMKSKSIPAVIKVDENFAKLFAYMLAEGHNSLYAISFTNNSIEIQKEYIELVERVFKEKACKIKRENCLLIYNQFLAQTLRKIGFTESSWTKSVPEQIILSKREARNAFLSAFLDCDGHVSNSGPIVEWCLASSKIIEAIQLMMSFSGIIAITKTKKVKGKDYSRLYVSGSKYLSFLNNELNLLIKHKRERLTLQSKLKSNTNIDTVPNIKNHLKSLLEILVLSQAKTKNSGIINYLNRRDNPSFESLQKLVYKFEERLNELERTIKEIKELHLQLPKTTEKEALNILTEAHNKGYHFNEIAKNTNISGTTARRMVRCITQPTTNAFKLAQNALMIQEQANTEIEKINMLDLNQTALKIKGLCEKIGFEQKELCKGAGFYKNALYGYEKGRHPQYSTILNFSEKLYSIALEKEKELPEAVQRIFFLKSILESNLFFDEITKIKRFTPEYQYVYDLMTENSNFIANGILVHNSYFVSILLEELLERKKEQGRIATMVLDVHGEYTSFAEPITDKKHKDYSNKTRLVRAREIKIGVPKISAGMLASILPGLSAPQKRDLGKVITKLQKEMREGLGPYNLNAIKSELLQDESIKENTQKALVGWIMELEELHIFSEVDSPSIEDIIGSGLLTVIDLSDIINLKKKQIIVNYLAHKLFDLRRKKIIPPFLLVLEESHQFIPEKAGRESAIARYILETIAREGRKFGASLCLISQRPIQLSTTVLSQCNTHIVLRITNPYDLKHIGESSEGLDQRALEMITVLRVGEALMLGEATGFPLFFKVRERRSLESKHEKSLEKAAIEFEEGNEKKEDEAKEFL